MGEINLHIVGVQKAGTTALASFLHQHPDIYVVDGKEAHVFDHPTFSQRANKPRIARLSFNKRLTNYQNERYLCDATPITLYRQEFISECVAYNPDAKFIVILRDPVKRAVSHYQMSKQRGQEKRSMLMAFLLEPFRLRPLQANGHWPIDSPMRTQSYLSRGCYKAQLKRLKTLVKPDQILVVTQESLINAHQQTLDTIFSFLDLEPVQVQAETVFESKPVESHWSDALATLYAKLYFGLRRF